MTIFDQYLALSPKCCNREAYWKANRKPHARFRMVPVSPTFSDLYLDFKVMILFDVK